MSRPANLNLGDRLNYAARLKRVGVVPTLGQTPSSAAGAAPSKRGRSQVRDVLGECLSVGAYFKCIPAPLNLAPVTGQAFWYGLQRFQAGGTGLPEFALSGVSLSVLACDVDGVGDVNDDNYANRVAWGDVRGITARLVVGRNLPIAVGAWRNAPAYLAGITPDGTGLVNPTTGGPEYFVAQRFAAGKFGDTTPNAIEKEISPGADQFRITQGQSLDVALVVRSYNTGGAAGSLANLGAQKYIYGFADWRLRLGLTNNLNSWTG